MLACGRQQHRGVLAIDANAGLTSSPAAVTTAAAAATELSDQRPQRLGTMR